MITHERSVTPNGTSEVSLLQIDVDPQGAVRFSRVWLLLATPGPLRATDVMAAHGMRFHWLAANAVIDVSSLPTEFVLAVTHGALEFSCDGGSPLVLRPGSLLRGTRIGAAQLRIHAGDHQPCRFAILATGVKIDPGPTTVAEVVTGTSIAYLNNLETAEGRSYCEHRRLPLCWRIGDCLMSETIPLSAFQTVIAAGTLDYDWHPAPQRQIVLVLTGGLAMEYGDGTHSCVLPGDFLVGEDLQGRGHRTRALLGAERLSIFAHLRENRVGGEDSD